MHVWYASLYSIVKRYANRYKSAECRYVGKSDKSLGQLRQAGCVRAVNTPSVGQPSTEFGSRQIVVVGESRAADEGTAGGGHLVAIACTANNSLATRYRSYCMSPPSSYALIAAARRRAAAETLTLTARAESRLSRGDERQVDDDGDRCVV